MSRNLIKEEDIKEEIRLINGSDTDYISPNGNVYKEYKNCLFLKKKVRMNEHNGYGYCGITMNTGEGNKSKRVHRLVAEAYIPKENDKPIVGHKDNNKMNNCASNLYWTTVSENTQKAFDDGLIVNAKGYEDSQSIEVILLNMNENYIKRYGSISECSRDINVSKSTISRHCKKESKSCRKGYDFFYNLDL